MSADAYPNIWTRIQRTAVTPSLHVAGPFKTKCFAVFFFATSAAAVVVVPFVLSFCALRCFQSNPFPRFIVSSARVKGVGIHVVYAHQAGNLLFS